MSETLEGMLMSGDQRPVILDIGYAYTRAGLAGDPAPRSIIKSTVYLDGTERRLFDLPQNVARERIAVFVSDLLLQKLCLSPNDRGILIVQNIMMPRPLRKALCDALFLDLEVPFVTFQSSHVCSLFSIGACTALVVDVGYKESHILPIADLYLISFSYRSASASFERLCMAMRDILLDNSVKLRKNGSYIDDENTRRDAVMAISMDTLEDICVRCCFVRSDEQKEEVSDITFSVSDLVATIPSNLRWEACEVLFDEGDDDITLADAIIETILECPIDFRRQMSESVVVVGGTCCLPGFMKRLSSELHKSLKKPEYEDKLFTDEIKFLVPCCAPFYAAWLGGSIYAATDSVKIQPKEKPKYRQGETAQDWFDLC